MGLSESRAAQREEALRESLLRTATRVAEAMRETTEIIGAIAGGSLGRGGAIDAHSDADIWLLYRGAPPDPAAIERAWQALDAKRVENGEFLVDGWRVEISAHDAGVLAEEFHDLIALKTPDAPDENAHWMFYSVTLTDAEGAVAALKEELNTYPETLRNRLIARATHAMEKPARQARVCAGRGDLPAFWSCVTAFVTAYMDALFAFNRLWHPGPKRFLSLHLARCPRRPPAAADQLARLLDLESGAPSLARAELVGSLHRELLTLLASK